MIRNDARLAKDVINDSDELFNPSHREPDNSENLVIPPPQEYSLFRSPKAGAPATDTLNLVRQEIVAIQRDAEERQEEDDDKFVSPDSMFNIGKKAKKEEPSGSANERLFGNISLSFFPISW